MILESNCNCNRLHWHVISPRSESHVSKNIEAHLGKINKINTSSQYHVYQLGHGNLRNKSY